MANTYESISSNVLGSSAASVTFSSIPSTYTDLVIRSSTRDATNGAITGSALITFNGSSSAVYNMYRLYWNGTAITGSGETNQTTGMNQIPAGAGSTATANAFGFWELYVPNYNATTNIAILGNGYTAYSSSSVQTPGFSGGRWTGNAAITSITLTSNGGTFATGSSFYLYGIKRN